ncbi:hypothetical protein MKX01_041331, partial [Papaver californicum]
ETLHKHKAANEESHGTGVTEKTTQENDEIGSTESESLYRNRPPKKFGRLNFTTGNVGQVLSVTGIYTICMISLIFFFMLARYSFNTYLDKHDFLESYLD